MCRDRVPSLSLSGSGLHFLYQVGAMHTLLCENIYTHCVCCTSAGMAGALYYLLDLRKEMPIEKLLCLLPSQYSRNQVKSEWRIMLEGCVSGVYHKNPLQRTRERMIEELCSVLCASRPNAFQKVSGRLRVTLVQWPSLRVHEFNHWYSNDDLLGCLRATTSIPYISTRSPTRWRGRCWIDGGAKDDHPIFNACTVVVTTSRYWQPWAPVWDAKKKWWGEISRCLDPESSRVVRCRAYYRRIFELGKKDARRFLRSGYCCCDPCDICCCCN